MARFAVLLLAAFPLLVVACGEERFPAGLDDDRYDLEAMALRESDFPEGYEFKQSDSFDNERFAEVFAEQDPEAKKRQLDAQGRIKSYIEFYSWAESPEVHLGRPVSFTIWSTLYVDAKAAADAIKNTCGLPVPDGAPVDEFVVPAIGDEGSGFFVTEELEQLGKLVDTNVCLRTGRVVHAVSQSGLDGTQDIGLSVRLAERMLKRVEEAFAGGQPDEEKVPKS